MEKTIIEVRTLIQAARWGNIFMTRSVSCVKISENNLFSYKYTKKCINRLRSKEIFNERRVNMDPINPTIWWENSALWSAVAACISAFFAGLTIYLRTKKSTREMIDIVKADILVFTSEADGRKAWRDISTMSQKLEGGGIGPRTIRLAELLAIKKKKRKGTESI